MLKPKQKPQSNPWQSNQWETNHGEQNGGIMIHMSHQYRSIVTKEEFARKAVEDFVFEEGSLGEAAIVHCERKTLE